jgi:ribose/xylose/arabinose/galactoside ABC-type transport system permease subunit
MKTKIPLNRLGIWLALLLEVAVLTLLTSTLRSGRFESTFLNWSNLSQVVRALSFIAIMAIGQSAVIIAGGVDLSVGSILGLSGVITTVMLSGSSFNIVPAMIVGTLAGGACGVMNGLLVTEAKLPPFIATLGMMSIARGLAFAITEGETIRNLPPSFLAIGQGTLAAVPVPVLVMVLLGAAATLFLRKSRTGRYVYAIGGNEEAAIYSGVRVKQVKLIVYAMSGLAAGIAGVLFVSRFGVGQSTAGLGYELDVIAAAVIGGISLSGGRGSVPGAIVGSLLMGILRNGLVLLNVSAYWQQVAIGLVIVLAVMLDRKARR